MEIRLDEKEVRLLGCLIEKEMTTPEYYPLSLNALTNACNQKSNRNPVVSYDEDTVLHGLDGLRGKGLSRETHSVANRVRKYTHALLDFFDLSRKEMAVLCELLLRGPQTVGEIRSRAGRIASFENLAETDGILRGLMEHVPPLVVQLPRETGRKERRYAHLLSGHPETLSVADGSPAKGATSSSRNDRIAALEEDVTRLRAEVEDLKKSLEELRSPSHRVEQREGSHPG